MAARPHRCAAILLGLPAAALQLNHSLPRASAGAALGHDPQWCPRSRWTLPTPEEVWTKQSTCGPHLPTTKGRPLVTEQGRFFFVEIPKAGSSTMLDILGERVANEEWSHLSSWEAFNIPKLQEEGFTAIGEDDVAGVTTFAVLRHPVKRFLSGYGTVVQRWYKGEDVNRTRYHVPELDPIMRLPDPERFRQFVALHLKNPDYVLDSRALMSHLRSQTFYLNAWPKPVDHFYALEDFDNSLKEISGLIGRELVPEIRNPQPGRNDEQLLQQHSTIQQLHDFFRPELERFSAWYQPLPGYH